MCRLLKNIYYPFESLLRRGLLFSQPSKYFHKQPRYIVLPWQLILPRVVQTMTNHDTVCLTYSQDRTRDADLRKLSEWSVQWHDLYISDMPSCVICTVTWSVVWSVRWHDLSCDLYSDMICRVTCTVTWSVARSVRWHDLSCDLYSDMIRRVICTDTWYVVWSVQWNNLSCDL